MNPEEKAVIRENLPKLISETGDLSNLKAQIVSRELLSSSEVQTIFSAPDTESQLYRFYDTIPRKGSGAFVKLVESLNETNNTHVGGFLKTSLDRKRSSLTSQFSISSGEDDVFQDSPRPKRFKLESLNSYETSIDESDDEDCTATYSQDCRIENGKMNTKRFLKILQQSMYSTSVILKEMSISGRMAEKVYLPKLQNYTWQNSTLDESDEIDTGVMLFFYKKDNFNSYTFSDICCTGVNVEINFAGEFVIISDGKANCVKVGGNRLLEEIGIGGLRKIFSSIKSNNCFPKRVELFDVNITRCPFPIDSSFLIKQLSMKDVSFSKVDVLQKTIEVCPVLEKIEMFNSTLEIKQKIELQVFRSETERNMGLQLSNFYIDSTSHNDVLPINSLELYSCCIPESLFSMGRQFTKLGTLVLRNCTSSEGDNILNNQTFLATLFSLDSLRNIRFLDVTQSTKDLLENNYGLKLSSFSNDLVLSRNPSGQFIAG